MSESKIQRIVRFKSNAQDSNWETLGRVVANKDGSSNLYFDLPEYLAVTDEHGNKFFKIPSTLYLATPGKKSELKVDSKGKIKSVPKSDIDQASEVPGF